MSNTNIPRNPALLVILDGFGINPSAENNAVKIARKPNLDRYFSELITTKLNASGRDVGLPDGQMGNSEVGHMIIGSGSVLRQDLVRIDDAITDRSFFENPVLISAIEKAKNKQRPLHLVGLVSDGGVHSHIKHLIALIQLCKEHHVVPTVHMTTDGRDTPPQSALHFLEQLEPALAEANGNISTVSGRYYSMDRDKRWDRTRRAWEAMIGNQAPFFPSARNAIEHAYENSQTDEFIEPVCIKGAYKIEPDDQVIFFNFRNDRARQMSYLLSSSYFAPFDRGDYQPRSLTCLTEYDPQLELPIAFEPEFPQATLASVLSDHDIQQLHCAETEKYAHVTFFLNGGVEKPHAGEQHIMIPSPDVATYDLQPEMSAKQVANEVINAITSGEYGFIVVNFANGDMVGHTAVPDAVIKAVETLDREVGRVLDAATATGFSVLLTADHGNCEQLVDPQTGAPHTQHTCFPVPCMVIDSEQWELMDNGGLSNIAPTLLQLMGISKPDCMTADSLLRPTHRQSLNKDAAA